ncbi:hypothetical protein [Moraxella bovoculi]|uniref:hypothetical protein n=1 Tax=Moraxella bovoculi TaxID=386891 RepID=UPI0006244BE6|nr:hypothetical protein [Moraxella bovoculi]AKG14248.1 hypothetical protein AAX11_09765 [Moraxella bovoculi]
MAEQLPFCARQLAAHNKRWEFGTHCFYARRLLAKHPDGITIRQAQASLALSYATAKAVLMAVGVERGERFYQQD